MHSPKFAFGHQSYPFHYPYGNSFSCARGINSYLRCVIGVLCSEAITNERLRRQTNWVPVARNQISKVVVDPLRNCDNIITGCVIQ